MFDRPVFDCPDRLWPLGLLRLGRGKGGLFVGLGSARLYSSGNPGSSRSDSSSGLVEPISEALTDPLGMAAAANHCWHT